MINGLLCGIFVLLVFIITGISRTNDLLEKLVNRDNEKGS